MIRGLSLVAACALLLLLPAATTAAADNLLPATGDPGSQIRDEIRAPDSDGERHATIGTSVFTLTSAPESRPAIPLVALAPVAFLLIFTGIGVLRESRQRRRGESPADRASERLVAPRPRRGLRL